MESWIKVKSYYNKSEAEMDKGFLESSGIQVSHVTFIQGVLRRSQK